ncbi:hypothetical protein GCM10007971_38680 [Oceanobacillus indicireducens]|uniref:Phage protein n=2 Tax=Oceanobacillus indicireducens TaxID=1004261 RepID=A0A917Y4A8_9BACI|nr:hypothetical protein GCM10007971_38680 [Oceanobacillus indicireducens]
MKNVMTKAWEIARNGQKKFGGKVKEYFAEALKMAWAIIKKGVKEVAEYPKVVIERAEEFLKSGDQPTKEFAMNKAIHEYDLFIKNYKKTYNFKAKKGQKTIPFEEFVNHLEKLTVDEYVKIMMAASNFAENYAK